MKYIRLYNIILITLLVLLCLTVVYLIKNQRIEYVAIENNNINNTITEDATYEDNNITVFNEKTINTSENIEEVNGETGIRIEFLLDCKAEADENLNSSMCDGFYGRYYIGEEIRIDGIYADGTSLSAKIKTDKQVIDIKVGTNFDGYWTASEDVKEGDVYNFTSTAYFLFKDGTIGKISTDDIKKGNYRITKLEQYKEIISLVSCNLPERTGGPENLYAVDVNNNIYFIDSVSVGA